MLYTIIRIITSFKKGFSLVEILVVLGLFSSIATLALGSLFNAQAINGRLQETQAILDNVNLSIQTVTRDIRFGSDFYCTNIIPTASTTVTVRKNCPNGSEGGSVLIFQPADAANELDRVAYYITSTGVMFKKEFYYGEEPRMVQMTASDVIIDSMRFYVEGANTATGINDEGNLSDFKQPIITMHISGRSVSVSSTREPEIFKIQTHISSREIDNR